MFFSHKNLVDSQVFSPAPGYYLHVYTPVACFFISLFFAVQCRTLHFNDYWEKTASLFGLMIIL